MHNTRTTTRAVTLVTGLCLGAIMPAFAAGFDCTQARSPVERAICADPVLGEQDEQLNARWREIRTLTQYPDALKSDQIAWIGKRNHCATGIACLRWNYARRLAELTPDAVSGPFDWTGTWVRIDSPAESGTLSLQKESENRYRVSAFAMSGGNMGELDGLARPSEGTLLLLSQDGDDDCRIVFRQVHRQLEVEQQSGSCGAGMGVDYSGRYVPVRTAPGAPLDQIDFSQVKPQWNLLNLGIVGHPGTDAEL
ncbi:MAG: lysozyme inhibitor LprI family protein, partial [Xanthomonadaceae bacterium]|nr:lysozyme inhibitor LprI family protein [Xanthomonadaceae bacterium]